MSGFCGGLELCATSRILLSLAFEVLQYTQALDPQRACTLWSFLFSTVCYTSLLRYFGGREGRGGERRRGGVFRVFLFFLFFLDFFGF